MIHTSSNKESANSEVRSNNREILISILTNIPIVLSLFSPMLLKTPSKTFDWYDLHTTSAWEIKARNGKNAAGNNEFNNTFDWYDLHATSIWEIKARNGKEHCQE